MAGSSLSLDEFSKSCGLRVLRALRRIIRAVDIHSRKLNSEFHITAPQMICLYSLFTDDGITLSQLAREVSLSASTVTGIVDRLESKGLVQRNRSTEDRRKITLVLTDAGRDVTKASPTLLQDRFVERLWSLPEHEQATIVLSLERVVEMMEVEHLDTSPNPIPDADVWRDQPSKDK